MDAENRRLPMVAFGLAILASTAVAHAAGEPRECVSVVEDAARLACYDAAFGRAGSRSPGAALPAISAAEAAAQAKKDFGLSEADKRALDPERAGPMQPESITGNVTAVRKRPTGEWVVTLGNGQVWVQAESDTKAIIRVGDEVTVRKAALGSFVLVSANRVAMRVRRVK